MNGSLKYTNLNVLTHLIIIKSWYKNRHFINCCCKYNCYNNFFLHHKLLFWVHALTHESFALFHSLLSCVTDSILAL